MVWRNSSVGRVSAQDPEGPGFESRFRLRSELALPTSFFLKQGTRSVLGDAVNSRTPSAHIKGWERAGGWSNLVPQLGRKTICRVRGIWAGHPTYFSAHMPSQTLRRLAFLEAGPLAGSVPRSASVPNLPRAERTAPPLARGPSRHPRPDRGPSPSRPPRTCSAHDLPITMPAARSGYAGAHGARGLTSHRGDS